MKDASAFRTRALFAALGISVAAAGIFAWQAQVRRAEVAVEREAREQAENQLSQVQQEASTLRDRLEELTREMRTIAESGNQTAEAALRRQREVEEALSQQNRSEREVQSALALTRSERDSLVDRVSALEAELERMRLQLGEADTRERDLQQSLEQAQRVAEAMKAQLQSKDQALASLETAYQRFKDSSQAGSRQLEFVTKTVTNLEDINRRRTAILEQAVRRLRELGDSYRTVAVRIGSNPEMQSTFNAEVGRLQSGVMAVEDQVSQINALNAQASQLERRLEQARTVN
jgi:chromosome segregation ATPase